jgi:DNA-binding LacI/PurR family transcriptional regulator
MAGPDRPTIVDVARAAGVSRTTVSHALNGRSDVSPATRERVIAVAEDLGYSASRTARALRSGRTGAIALQLPDFTGDERDPFEEDYFVQVAAAAANAAFARRYSLLLAPRLEDGGAIRSLGVDGAILCDPNTHDERIALFERAGVPLVTIGRDVSRDDGAHVRADSYGNMTTLLNHLRAMGASRIALMTPSTSWGYVRDSTESYNDWVAEHGLSPEIVLISEVPAARQEAVKLLSDTQRPDAVIGLVERVCIGILAAASELRVAVPDELLVACAVDGRQISTGDPAVTAVDIHPREQGHAAVELLLERVEGRATDGPIISSSELRVRASTLKPAP